MGSQTSTVEYQIRPSYTTYGPWQGEYKHMKDLVTNKLQAGNFQNAIRAMSNAYDLMNATVEVIDTQGGNLKKNWHGHNANKMRVELAKLHETAVELRKKSVSIRRALERQKSTIEWAKENYPKAERPDTAQLLMHIADDLGTAAPPWTIKRFGQTIYNMVKDGAHWHDIEWPGKSTYDYCVKIKARNDRRAGGFLDDGRRHSLGYRTKADYNSFPDKVEVTSPTVNAVASPPAFTPASPDGMGIPDFTAPPAYNPVSSPDYSPGKLSPHEPPSFDPSPYNPPEIGTDLADVGTGMGSNLGGSGLGGAPGAGSGVPGGTPGGPGSGLGNAGSLTGLGRGGMGMPMMPMGGNGAGDEEERSRMTWLVEDDDIWGGGENATPQLIE